MKRHLVKRHPNDGWIFADPRKMSGSTRRALRGLVRAYCPPEPEIPDLEDRLEVHVRRMLQYMTPVVALGFVVAVHVLDWAPVWRLSATRRVRHLPREQGARLLMEIGTSRSLLIRTMVLATRGLILSSFYDQDEVHQAMHWNPLPFFSDRIELRQRLIASPAGRDGDATLPMNQEAAS